MNTRAVWNVIAASVSRPLSDLIVDGVEFCDTLVLNKTDLISDMELDAVRADIRALQSDATLIATEFGDVEPSTILGSEHFDQLVDFDHSDAFVLLNLSLENASVNTS